MSTLVVSVQSKAGAAHRELSSLRAAGRVEEDGMRPKVEELPPVLVPVFTGGPLFRLASFISAIYVGLFGRSAPHCNPAEEPDSDYPRYGSCCC
jgi:hypothetical protein